MTFRLYEGKESDFQKSVHQICVSRKLFAFHVANERDAKKKISHAIMAGQGVVGGVSDYIILEPRGGYHGMIVELKAKLNQPKENQIEFLINAHQRGYFALLTWSMDEFIHYLDQYMNLGYGKKIKPTKSFYKNLQGKVYEIGANNRIKVYKKT